MTNDKQTEPNTTHQVITQEALAQLGDGRLAYVKTIRSEDVASLFPAGAEDCARHQAIRAACGGRHADHADRHARSCARECLEPGTRARQRALSTKKN